MEEPTVFLWVVIPCSLADGYCFTKTILHQKPENKTTINKQLTLVLEPAASTPHNPYMPVTVLVLSQKLLHITTEH